MGTENKDKDSKTEAVIDVIVAIGKTIFDILNENFSKLLKLSLFPAFNVKLNKVPINSINFNNIFFFIKIS